MSAPKKEKAPKKPPAKPAEKGGPNAGGGKPRQQQQAKAKPAADNEDVKRDQKLQAIVLADSFSKTFRPITLEGPKVLLPLVNVPMLEYTVEFLAQNGVEEVFVFCASHADKVEAYVRKRRWRDSITVKCVSSPGCQSAGDALRELDAMGVVRSDPFILISGDVVSNLDLKKAIAFHRAKRREDHNAIMTVVLKKAPAFAPARSLFDNLVVTMNKSGQIVLFDDSFQKSHVSFPVEIMEESHDLVFECDMLDCNVDICSPELILQFSDNFDYLDIRRDFVHNEVCNFALGKHVYGYVITDEYAARVQDPRTYASISRDIVTRWVYPLVPEAHLLADSSYIQGKRYNYKESNVRVNRSANIIESVVIGAGATIGDRAVLTRCTLGRNVSIGTDCALTDVHVWENAVIGPGTHITQSIVCNDCVVGAGVRIPRGCILSYGVHIPEGTVLPEYARVVRKGVVTEEDMGGAQPLPGTDCLLWKFTEASYPAGYDADLPEALTPDQVMRMGSIGCREEEAWRAALWRDMARPEEDDDSDDDLSDSAAADLGAGFDAMSLAPRHAGHKGFGEQVEELVAAAHVEGHDINAVLMEIKSMKFAQNKTYGDCLRGVMPALLSTAAATSTAAMAVVKALKGMFEEDSWACVLVDALVQGPEDEAAVVEAVEDWLLGHPQSATLRPAFRFILQILYDAEMLSEEGIHEWVSQRRCGMDDDRHAEERKALFFDPRTQEFVQWIEAGDEDDDEEDEEDEEGSSEEEEDGTDED